ncbi:MAG: RsmB/NOP family class I SAM-dependent RNA methyltransferase [Hyphomonadaceae bacterium]
MPPPSPRRAAADLVIAVLDDGRALEEAMARTPSFAALEGRDRGFARAIASATLRRLGGVDAVLAAFLAKPLPPSARLARALLRTGAAQMLALGTAPHAAVSETVSLARADRSAAGFANLINAVLRKAGGPEGQARFAALPPGADLPAWLFTRWRAAYGERAGAIASALRNEPPLDLSVKADAARWAGETGGALAPNSSVRLQPGHAAPELLPGYGEGAWWVQDAAAALPTALLGDVAGKNVLDLCAAPGGKTMQLANAGARVTALDTSAERLTRLKANLARTKLQAETIAADALNWEAPQQFDAVLLDAPCTATGILRRHPDLAWLRRPNDIPTLAKLQSEMLARAARFLPAGGALVYAVCSLEPEEGPNIVAQAIKSGLWRRAPIRAAEIHDQPALLTAAGDLRTTPAHWPEIGGMDGFYAARLIRL